MRLALVCTEKLPVPPIRGGAIQTYMAGVLPYLSQRHAVTVIGRSDPELSDWEERDGVRFVRVAAGAQPPDYYQNVAAVLATAEWDLVEIFNRPAYVETLAGAAPGARLVLSMHNDMFQYHRMDPAASRACLQRVEAVVTISEYVRQEIDRLHPGFAGKMRTIRSGVDLDRFRPRRDDEVRFCEGPVVLTVGRLSEKKGIHVILHAMEQVLDSHPEALLLVVGSRWYGSNDEDEYVRAIRQQALPLGDSVRFTGYVPYDRMPEIFRAGDLFICGSQWQEPLARVHYEAMASGLPMITTDRGGNAEVVEEGGNGLLVRPHHSPTAFAQAISTLLADRPVRERMGRRGRFLAERAFSWERVARELLEVVEGR